MVNLSPSLCFLLCHESYHFYTLLKQKKYLKTLKIYWVIVKTQKTVLKIINHHSVLTLKKITVSQDLQRNICTENIVFLIFQHHSRKINYILAISCWAGMDIFPLWHCKIRIKKLSVITTKSLWQDVGKMAYRTILMSYK